MHPLLRYTQGFANAPQLPCRYTVAGTRTPYRRYFHVVVHVHPLSRHFLTVMLVRAQRPFPAKFRINLHACTPVSRHYRMWCVRMYKT